MAGSDANAFPIHRNRKQSWTRSDSAKHCIVRYEDIIQDQLADLAGAQTHLLELLSILKSRSILFHYKGRNSAVVTFFGIRDCIENCKVSNGTIGAEDFSSINLKTIFIFFGSGGHRKCIGAGSGLRHSVYGNQFSAAQPW